MNQMLGEIQNQQMMAKLQDLMKLWRIAQSAANPEKFLLEELSRNENCKEIFDILKANNGNFEKTVYDYAKKTGNGNIEEFLSTLRQSMGLR